VVVADVIENLLDVDEERALGEVVGLVPADGAPEHEVVVQPDVRLLAAAEIRIGAEVALAPRVPVEVVEASVVEGLAPARHDAQRSLLVGASRSQRLRGGGSAMFTMLSMTLSAK
jgi:hypothetical protein